MKQVPEPEAISRFAADAGLNQAGDTCDADTLSTRAEFWRLVKEMRSAEPQSTPMASDGALQEANLIQQISCSPTNGVAWAELAAIEAETSGWTDKVMRYLALSQQYTPYEGLALEMRLTLLGSSDAGPNERVREILRRDLATILHHAEPTYAAGEIAILRGGDRTWAEAFMQSLSADRIAAIQSALKALPDRQLN